MANLDLKHKINVPFADKGNRDDIPDTSSDGLVNNTDGLGIKYEQEIPEGGEYFERETFNGILYKVYAAVKELQDFAITAGFPVDMTKALNVLPLVNGGTGAKNAAKARENLQLGKLAILNTINDKNIDNNAVTNQKIKNGAVTNNKIGEPVSILNGGTGATSLNLAQINLQILKYERNDYISLNLNQAPSGLIVCRTDYLLNYPSWLISSGEVIILTLLSQTSSVFGITDAYSYNVQIYQSRSSKAIAMRICSPNSSIGQWQLLVDDDGRNTLNMPIPTSQYGIGQIYNISSYGSFTLPAGGTWFLSCYQKTGDIDGQITKIVSGGYSETYAGRSYLGFAIRIK